MRSCLDELNSTWSRVKALTIELSERGKKMNTKFVATYALLARLRNVRRVAKQLHVTPGAVSMRVKSLERDLNVVLFNWDHRQLSLTPEGERLLPYADALLNAEREFDRIAASSDGIAGSIRVGMIESAIHTFLPDFMRRLETRFPHVRLDLQVDLTAQLNEKLMRKELDLVFCVAGANENPYVVYEDIMELPMHWVAKRRLISAQNPLSSVFRWPILTFMRGTVPYEASLVLACKLAQQQGVASSDLRVMDTPTIAALISLVREGVGTAILPGVLVKELLERNELVTLSLPSPDPFRLCAAYSKNCVPLVENVVFEGRKAARRYCQRLGDLWVGRHDAAYKTTRAAVGRR